MNTWDKPYNVTVKYVKKMIETIMEAWWLFAVHIEMENELKDIVATRKNIAKIMITTYCITTNVRMEYGRCLSVVFLETYEL